jgi:hypothetical protein
MVLLWGLSPPLLAQFGGGRGDGLDYSDSPQLTLDGVPSGLRPLYGGGPGDGVDQLTASFGLNGATASALYGGGRGDGFDQSSASFGLEGSDLAVLFGGNSGDGFDQDIANVSLGGVSLNVLFGGSAGDGFDREAANFALNGTSIAGLYGGGVGDGFDQRLAALALDGTNFEALFGGGLGDGFDRNIGAFALSGQDLSILYGGGAGDGFDVELFDGVIPLPLTLISFDAFPEDNFVLLRWVTEDEVSTDFFTIEKTQDGSVPLPGWGRHLLLGSPSPESNCITVCGTKPPTRARPSTDLKRPTLTGPSVSAIWWRSTIPRLRIGVYPLPQSQYRATLQPTDRGRYRSGSHAAANI